MSSNEDLLKYISNLEKALFWATCNKLSKNISFQILKEKEDMGFKNKMLENSLQYILSYSGTSEHDSPMDFLVFEGGL